MNYTILIKIWIFIIAILIGLSIHFLVIRDKVLKPLSLIDTYKSLKIQYQQYLNSVLIYVIQSQYWIWYDGKDVLVYGLPTGRICNDSYCTGNKESCTDKSEKDCISDKECTWEKYEPVYIYNTTVNKAVGYQCAKPLYEIQSFYCCKKARKEYIFIPNPNNKQLTMLDIMNEFIKRKIISIKYKGDSVYKKGSKSSYIPPAKTTN